MSMMPGQTQPEQLNELLALIASLKQSEPERASILEARLAEISAMTPEEQAVAIADLTESYGERRNDLRDELSQNYDMLTAEGPQGQMAGNNQFSVYVGANPLEHLASGYGKYQAGKGVKENRGALDELSKRESGAQSGVMGAAARAAGPAEAAALRAGVPETPMQRFAREEEERKRYEATLLGR